MPQNSSTGCLRGWKDIAAHLGASVRSVQRWEQTRGLPIRRAAGAARDAVFARIDELDCWQTAPGDEAEPPPEALIRDPPDAESGGKAVRPEARPAPRRRLLPVVVVAAASVVAVSVFLASRRLGPPTAATRGGDGAAAAAGAASRAPASRPYLLRVTGGSGRPMVVGVADGATGSVDLSGGQRLDLRPRRRPDGLLVEIITSGAPSPSADATRRPTVTLVLEPNSRVRVPTPPAFDIEWIQPPRGAAGGRPPVVPR